MDNDSVGRNDAVLIRFDNLFANEGGAIPENATITSASLLLTTSKGDGIVDPGATTASTPTKSTVSAHQMLKPWGTTTLWNEAFGDLNSPDIGIDISAVLDSSTNLIADSQAMLDVTAAVSHWQSGGTNHGFFVQLDSGDAWRLAAPGYGEASGRPTLLVEYVVHSADFNQDEKVDGLDFLTWQREFSTGSSFAEGDANFDGIVNASDLEIWQSQYGNPPTISLTAVPEPTAMLFTLAGVFTAMVSRITTCRKGRMLCIYFDSCSLIEVK